MRGTQNKGFRGVLKKVCATAMLSIVGLSLIAYGLDYVVFRYKVAKSQQPFGQVTVNSFDAVKQKNGKTEFIFNPPQVQTCANALFPRSGYLPCWYLQRHTEPRTDI
jgi:hypothetical protein